MIFNIHTGGAIEIIIFAREKASKNTSIFEISRNYYHKIKLKTFVLSVNE